MKLFASLYKSLLSTTDIAEKSNLIQYYLEQVNGKEKIITIKLLLHGKSGPILSAKSMIKLVMERMNMSEKLIKECYKASQDWVETCSLIVANPRVENSNYALSSILHEINCGIPDPIDFCIDKWNSLSTNETWLFNKLITGTLRPLISIPQLSKIIASKWNTGHELIHLRLCMYTLHELTFDQLIDLNRSTEELNFLPYTFVRPNESHINFSLEKSGEYSIEPFIYGERILLIKSEHNLIAYTIQGEWKHPVTEAWHMLIPDASRLEMILTEDKTWIVNITRWMGKNIDNYSDAKSTAIKWINENDLTEQIESVNNIEIKDWASIYEPGDKIIKHKNDPNKWYRIKPKPHELTAVLWYAEMPVATHSMNLKLSLAIRTDQRELITICQLSSSEMSETEQTRLYYWIQNNTIQKFGPVRTVRPLQNFIISYDRVKINKRVKLGYSLINVKILEWIKDGRMVSLSMVSDIII